MKAKIDTCSIFCVVFSLIDYICALSFPIIDIIVIVQKMTKLYVKPVLPSCKLPCILQGFMNINNMRLITKLLH